MSNPFEHTNLRYFQLPQTLTTMNILQQLSGNDLSLLISLYSEAQRTSKGTIVATGTVISQRTGISISKVGTARRSLVDFGLIKTEKIGHSHQYTLCNPENGTPIVKERSLSERFDFDQLTPDQVRSYFIHRLQHSSPKDTLNGLEACCPLHDDVRPSLSVNCEGGGKWQCHGCGEKGRLVHFEMALAKKATGASISAPEARRRVIDVMRQIGVIDSAMEQPEARYEYSDGMGEVVFEVLRFPGKKFVQRKPDGRGGYINNVKDCPKLVYHLGEVDLARTVCVCEGEKDVDRVRGLGLRDAHGYEIAATCNSGGAGKWSLRALPLPTCMFAVPLGMAPNTTKGTKLYGPCPTCDCKRTRCQ